MDKYNDIKFNDLTDDQMGQMSETDIVNKALSEYVDEINAHTSDIISCRTHGILTFLMVILLTVTFGYWGLFGLIPVLYFGIGYFKLSNSIVWHLRSFKSTSSMYSTLGYDYLVDKHINDIDCIEDIGKLYDIK